MKHIVIIGCGAVGALYGLKLHERFGKDQVCFLVDNDRKERYETQGIYLNDEKAPFRYCTKETVETADLVLLATKNHHLASAIDLMRPAVGTNTAILSLLNGIESERILSQTFGKEKVLYGFAVGLNSTHVGNQITYTKEGKIVFGEKDNSETDRIRIIRSWFEEADIAYMVPQDIHREQWNKFMLNTAYNTISALLGATYQDLDQESVWSLAQAVCKEVQAVAKAEQVILPDSLIAENHRIVTSLGLGKTSMCQDMEAGRETENRWFCGTVIALGKEHQISTPTCQTLSDLVEAKQAITFRAR